MYKIGVIGDRATVAGFIALGYTVYEVEDPADAAEILHRIANEDYAIIFVTEAIAEAIPGDIGKYNGSMTPAVTVLPDKKSADGALSYGMAQIKRHVEVAVGADILFRE